MNDSDDLTSSSVVHASRDQVSADLAGETAILDLADGTYYGLNDVGTLIWKMLQQPVTVAAIRDAIVDHYDVTSSDAERDLLTLLADLRAKHLIEVD